MKTETGPMGGCGGWRSFLSAEDESGLPRRDPASWAERHRESLCCEYLGQTLGGYWHSRFLPRCAGVCVRRGLCVKCGSEHLCECMCVCEWVCVLCGPVKGGHCVKVTSEMNTAQTTLCFEIHSLKCNTLNSIYESFLCLFPCIYSYSCVILEYIYYKKIKHCKKSFVSVATNSLSKPHFMWLTVRARTGLP